MILKNNNLEKKLKNIRYKSKERQLSSRTRKIINQAGSHLRSKVLIKKPICGCQNLNWLYHRHKTKSILTYSSIFWKLLLQLIKLETLNLILLLTLDRSMNLSFKPLIYEISGTPLFKIGSSKYHQDWQDLKFKRHYSTTKR